MDLFRYVEANPLWMVQQAKAWPVSRPPRWEQQVNEWMDARTRERGI